MQLHAGAWQLRLAAATGCVVCTLLLLTRLFADSQEDAPGAAGPGGGHMAGKLVVLKGLEGRQVLC